MPNVLSKGLVSRPDKMDETVQHTFLYLKFQAFREEFRSTCLPASSNTGTVLCLSGFSKMTIVCFLFLFDSCLTLPVNNFSVMLRRSHLFLGITSTFGE